MEQSVCIDADMIARAAFVPADNIAERRPQLVCQRAVTAVLLVFIQSGKEP